MSQTQKTAKDLLKRVRLDLQDRVEPYFWSDDELLMYLTEGQQEITRPDIGAPIIDSRTPEVCEIAFSANDTELPLHPSIYKILTAFRDDDDSTGRLHELQIATETNWLALYPQRPADYGNTELADHSFTQATTVRTIFIDFSQGYIRFASPALNAGILRLRVERGPIKELDCATAKVEVNPRLHSGIIAWANRLAYLKQDSEIFDEKAANRWEERFNKFAELANLEYVRSTSTPGTVICNFP